MFRAYGAARSADQARDPMQRPDRPIQKCPQLHPQTIDTTLGWVHALAVQTSVFVIDRMMLATFGAHGESVAVGSSASEGLEVYVGGRSDKVSS